MEFLKLRKGDLDFDILSANSTVVSRSLVISNRGTKSGSFRLKYLGKEVKLSQLFGKIKPGKSTEIHAEIVTDKPKIVEELLEIYLSGENNSKKVAISANVVNRQIAILDNSNEPISFADFGHIYSQARCSNFKLFPIFYFVSDLVERLEGYLGPLWDYNQRSAFGILSQSGNDSLSIPNPDPESQILHTQSHSNSDHRSEVAFMQTNLPY